MGIETPDFQSVAQGHRETARRRLPWVPVVIALGTLVAVAAWYVLTVDAISNDGETIMRNGSLGIPLTGMDPEAGTSFANYSLKNVSVLPITIIRIAPVQVSSDWRFSVMRLGAWLTTESLRYTRPFTPQHLAPGRVADVVIVWEMLPCDSPGLEDDRVSGPVAFRITYSILGIRRTKTIREEGGSFPLSVTRCSRS